ncbi:adenosylmethionine-8-amino-7-oxononanoate aminotransferase [Scopulibacillus darangshiensis]|uniref:Adenosylmethionine-8-amino-7-oxononanoate aminotransferase n=1 Tax=Scopulibacillus darangshiensis TaxID=442528 RepID=A0A4R2P7T7_9BACL|nr:aspartate aminotransferase family protein [Scopulibacillus darangshiensis]TCP30877.1 adenosylmethionine-8-amino-7-oxononanoate aminotransferase [Scopulibacillus darangshiensis]
MSEKVSIKKTKMESLSELDRKHYLHPTTPAKMHFEQGPSIIVSEGKGINIKDVKGDEYIDAMSMLWNVNLGHGQKELADAAQEQMMKLAYSSSFFGNSHETAIQLAEKLASLTPDDLNVVFYTSGGSESNDTAFKLSRYYWQIKGQPERTKIIGLERAYHGVTMGATSATGVREFQNFVNAKAPDFFHAKAHQTNCELGDKSDPNYEGCIRDIVEKEGPDTIAAVILEPVQGAGGVLFPPEGYMQAVRKLCDEFGILMITDEVITGFGRTGKMFGVNNWDVVPDMMTVAKGITSGYSQLGAVIMKEKIRDEIVKTDDVLFHGFTYSGHPTACAVALKNLEILERDNLVVNAKNMEKVLKDGMAFLEEKHSIVTKTRALGLLGAFELYEDPASGKPFDPSIAAAHKVVDECFKRKLILRTAEWDGDNIVAIAPALIVNKQEIENIISILDESITAFEMTL